MRTETKGSQVIVFLEGRIDSSNAADIQAELKRITEEHPGSGLVLDAGNLTYISSAGLRVLLLLARGAADRPVVRNASPEVYEIFEITGFTSIFSVTRKLREVRIDGCPLIGKGAIGSVYRLDEDTVVKVYDSPDSLPMIENEQKRAKQALLKGIPTAISYDVVKVGDRYGSVFEMLKASTFNDRLIEHPEDRDSIVREYVRFIRQVHAVEADPGELPEARAVFLSYLEELRAPLGDELYGRLREMLCRMPENLHIVHGDIQMRNVMVSGDEPLLIDMDTLSVGDPVFDLMGLYMTYVLFNVHEPDNAMIFYGVSQEMCSFVWEKTLQYYFDGRDPESVRIAEKKIAILACVRFLYLVLILGIGRQDLKEVRASFAVEMLRDLTGQVDSLEII